MDRDAGTPSDIHVRRDGSKLFKFKSEIPVVPSSSPLENLQGGTRPPPPPREVSCQAAFRSPETLSWRQGSNIWSSKLGIVPMFQVRKVMGPTRSVADNANIAIWFNDSVHSPPQDRKNISLSKSSLISPSWPF
jgi:hypothetical protein